MGRFVFSGAYCIELWQTGWLFMIRIGGICAHCCWKCFVFFTANEIHFICGGKYYWYRQHKNLTSNSKINSKRAALAKPDQGEKLLPNPPTWWVKKHYPLLFSKYEIHKGWHWYRIHKKAEIYIGVPAGKKDRKYLIKKSINQLPIRMPRLNGGGEVFFSANKNIGTRVGD